MAATAIHTPAPTGLKASNPGSPPIARPTRVTLSQPARGQTGPPAVRLSRRPQIARPDSSRDSLVGGQPLETSVQEKIEGSFNVDLSSVRVHSDTKAREAASNLSARAITYGSQILLGPAERSNDIRLLAHEAAHVVQQQGAARVQPWAEGHNDRYEHEARQASSAVVQQQPFSVNQRTGGSRIQRLGISNVLDYFADKANNIPGFRMFTIILGVNPINMSRVERSAANILRALIEFLPGGKLITDAMENNGVFEKIGNWVDEQIRTLGISGSAIKDGIMKFLDSLGWSDILHPGDVWDRAKRIFTDPIERIIKFAKGMVTGIIKFIKDAILRPLAKLAEGTRGYDLLRAILKKDPVTGEPYPRTAETLIGGFMKLIGQEEIWENMKKAKAVQRAGAWFESVMKELLGFVQRIPTLFIDAFKSLEIMDIVLVPRAFYKIAKVFGGFILDFIRWGGNAVWTLLQIIFEVVAPEVVPYLKKVGAAFKLILKNPIGFVKNLVKAGIQGFRLFASNIGKHLRTSIIEWLTGSLTGVYIPQSLEFREIVKFVLSVLGLTWANIRQKLVKVMGETAVKAMETGFDLVVTLVTQGPAAAWEKIKEQLGNLKEMAMQAIMDFVIETVVAKAVAKILSMFVPGAAFISAILSIYDTIMVFIAKLQKIIQVAKAFLDSIVSIANGVITAAAEKVESTLAGLLTLAINFLAGFVGLGKIADKVMNIINTKIRGPIDKALDKVIDWIVTMAKKLFGMAKAGVKKLIAWWKLEEPVNGGGESHTLKFKGEGKQAQLLVFTDPKPPRVFIKDFLEIKGTEADRTEAQDWDVKITATQKQLAAAEGANDDAKFESLSKTLKSQLGSLSLVLQRLLNKGEQEGNEGNPLPIDYPKRRASAYPIIYVGPRVGEGIRINQSWLASLLGKPNAEAKKGLLAKEPSLKKNKGFDDWKGTVEAWPPNKEGTLGGKPIGLSPEFASLAPGKILVVSSKEGTGGGHKINDCFKPFGFVPSSKGGEGLDGDHVLERQLGGPDELRNLWPLDKSENRSSGSTVKNLKVKYKDKEMVVHAARKARKKESIFLLVRSVRG